MKFIKLTREDTIFFVNPQHIKFMIQNTNHTSICFNDGVGKTLRVDENVDDILCMIEEVGEE